MLADTTHFAQRQLTIQSAWEFLDLTGTQPTQPFAKKRFTAIGECMVELAATGEGIFRQGFAGDTFNAAWHARRTLPPEWTVSYFTAVGDDSMSTRMLAFMRREGIETDRVRRMAGKSPGLYTIELNSGERSFNYWRDTSAARSLADDADVLTQAVEESDAILFSGITLAILSPAGRETLFAVLARARARGAMVVFDSNIRLRLWPHAAAAREAVMTAAGIATMALPTESDEAALFGETGQRAVAERYVAAGVTEVVVKAGPQPALIMWPRGHALLGPDQPINPVDTTGAGDSFNGSYVANRLLGHSPEVAARFAHVAAGRVIQAFGALV